jgi:hypothetical protein
MLKVSGRETFGKSSTGVRMDSTLRVGSDRKGKMDKPFGSCIERPRIAEGGAESLKGGPHIGVILRDVLRDWRQIDRRILREVGGR